MLCHVQHHATKTCSQSGVVMKTNHTTTVCIAHELMCVGVIALIKPAGENEEQFVKCSGTEKQSARETHC